MIGTMNRMIGGCPGEGVDDGDDGDGCLEIDGLMLVCFCGLARII